MWEADMGVCERIGRALDYLEAVGVNEDTLTQIARRNGTTVAALCKLNKIDKDAVIRIGQRLRIK